MKDIREKRKQYKLTPNDLLARKEYNYALLFKIQDTINTTTLSITEIEERIQFKGLQDWIDITLDNLDNNIDNDFRMRISVAEKTLIKLIAMLTNVA